jgi:hypothetical protein
MLYYIPGKTGGMNVIWPTSIPAHFIAAPRTWAKKNQ